MLLLVAAIEVSATRASIVFAVVAGKIRWSSARRRGTEKAARLGWPGATTVQGPQERRVGRRP